VSGKKPQRKQGKKTREEVVDDGENTEWALVADMGRMGRSSAKL
jgi:hypothetical protein